MPVYLYVCLFICLSVYLYVCLSVCLFLVFYATAITFLVENILKWKRETMEKTEQVWAMRRGRLE